MLSASRIRILAAKAGLNSVAVRNGEVKLQFAKDVHMDGGKLFMLVSGTKGAQLTVSDPPSVMIRDKTKDAPRLIKELPQFLYSVASCCDTIDGI